jgi:hypothetical protein
LKQRKPGTRRSETEKTQSPNNNRKHKSNKTTYQKYEEILQQMYDCHERNHLQATFFLKKKRTTRSSSAVGEFGFIRFISNSSVAAGNRRAVARPTDADVVVFVARQNMVTQKSKRKKETDLRAASARIATLEQHRLRFPLLQYRDQSV